VTDKTLELTGDPARVILKIPEEWARVLGLTEKQSQQTLADLLKKSDYSQPQPPEEREWVDAPSAGNELL